MAGNNNLSGGHLMVLIVAVLVAAITVPVFLNITTITTATAENDPNEWIDTAYYWADANGLFEEATYHVTIQFADGVVVDTARLIDPAGVTVAQQTLPPGDSAVRFELARAPQAGDDYDLYIETVDGVEYQTTVAFEERNVITSGLSRSE